MMCCVESDPRVLARWKGEAGLVERGLRGQWELSNILSGPTNAVSEAECLSRIRYLQRPYSTGWSTVYENPPKLAVFDPSTGLGLPHLLVPIPAEGMAGGECYNVRPK